MEPPVRMNMAAPSPWAENVRERKRSRARTGLFRQAIVARARQPRSRASDAQEAAGIGITRESE